MPEAGSLVCLTKILKLKGESGGLCVANTHGRMYF